MLCSAERVDEARHVGAVFGVRNVVFVYVEQVRLARQKKVSVEGARSCESAISAHFAANLGKRATKRVFSALIVNL